MFHGRDVPDAVRQRAPEVRRGDSPRGQHNPAGPRRGAGRVLLDDGPRAREERGRKGLRGLQVPHVRVQPQPRNPARARPAQPAAAAGEAAREEDHQRHRAHREEPGGQGQDNQGDSAGVHDRGVGRRPQEGTRKTGGVRMKIFPPYRPILSGPFFTFLTSVCMGN